MQFLTGRLSDGEENKREGKKKERCIDGNRRQAKGFHGYKQPTARWRSRDKEREEGWDVDEMGQ